MPDSKTFDGVASTPVLVITGPVGVGKTTVAEAISETLSARHVAHAMVDMDHLRWCVPSPPDDPFHTRLGMANLTAIWKNYQAAGAALLILADVVEFKESVEDYRRTIDGSAITIVRLTASLPTLHARLEDRDAGESLSWHRNRAAELSELMEQRSIGDFVIDTEGKTAIEIAREILSHPDFR